MMSSGFHVPLDFDIACVQHDIENPAEKSDMVFMLPSPMTQYDINIIVCV
jgi:hypothetical protein